MLQVQVFNGYFMFLVPEVLLYWKKSQTFQFWTKPILQFGCFKSKQISSAELLLLDEHDLRRGVIPLPDKTQHTFMWLSKYGHLQQNIYFLKVPTKAWDSHTQIWVCKKAKPNNGTNEPALMVVEFTVYLQNWRYGLLRGPTSSFSNFWCSVVNFSSKLNNF